jgi:hypothetical protein
MLMKTEVTTDVRTQSTNPQVDRPMQTMRRWSHFFDKAFRIPGTKWRFGWDPILGLIPGLGDIATGLFSLFLLITAFRLKVPGIIRARMILNAFIDVFSGIIPLIGDVFDFAWKSNSMNLALLEKHAGSGVRSKASDWLFVLGIMAAAVAIVIIPLMVLAAVLQKLGTRFLGSPLFGSSLFL